jgi:hypothetical protein
MTMRALIYVVGKDDLIKQLLQEGYTVCNHHCKYISIEEARTLLDSSHSGILLIVGTDPTQAQSLLGLAREPRPASRMERVFVSMRFQDHRVSPGVRVYLDHESPDKLYKILDEVVSNMVIVTQQ